MLTRRPALPLILAASIMLISHAVSGVQSLGTVSHPILFFVPLSQDEERMRRIAERIASRLSEATGLRIDAVLGSSSGMAEALASANGDSFGALTNVEYVSHEGLTARLSANSTADDSFPFLVSAIYARRDSGVRQLADLNGKRWGFVHSASPTGYKYAEGFFAAMDVSPGQQLVCGSHASAIYSEPPRDCRRPNGLRGWRHGKTEQVLPRGAGTSGADGVRERA